MSIQNTSTSAIQAQASEPKKKGRENKMAEYTQLAQQAQLLGLQNIPAPVKGEKGSLDQAISALQAMIAQAQQKNNTNTVLFADSTVGLTSIRHATTRQNTQFIG